MILTPEVLALFVLNFIFTILSIYVFVLSIKIFLYWDINSTSSYQYYLQKQSYLATTIIKYIFILKIPLFIFFIFTLDKISNILTGAMCSAGVLDATDYGSYLIILKILNLYFFAYWLKLHAQDVKLEYQPYTKLKFGVFLLLFLLFISEIVLEFIMFNAIDVDKLVSCCGSLYSSSSTSIISSIFTINNATIVTLFYLNFAFILLFSFFKNRYFFTLANMFFIFISLVSLILFFGTYIYELPSHHCPFCFLQSDYYYVGYLLYSLLFVGTFYGLMVALLKDSDKSYRISVIFNTLYVLVVSLYVVLYYLNNGVWL